MVFDQFIDLQPEIPGVAEELGPLQLRLASVAVKHEVVDPTQESVGKNYIIRDHAERIFRDAWFSDIESDKTVALRDLGSRVRGQQAQISVFGIVQSDTDNDNESFYQARVIQDEGHAQPEVGTLYIPVAALQDELIAAEGNPYPAIVELSITEEDVHPN